MIENEELQALYVVDYQNVNKLNATSLDCSGKNLVKVFLKEKSVA